jgi:hypothetical protein
MTNYVYLITNGCGCYKVGFTRNWLRRLNQYIEYNPDTRAISTVATYGKTKMALEKVIHSEITAMGYKFKKNLFHNETEWFEPTEEFAEELKEKGLLAFKACKNRKVVYC